MAKSKAKAKAKPEIKNVGGRPRIHPVIDTPFSLWLDGQSLDMAAVSEDLEIALSTAYNLKNGTFCPSLQLAARIEVFTDGSIVMQDWCPEILE
jgi:hypothetical protein